MKLNLKRIFYSLSKKINKELQDFEVKNVIFNCNIIFEEYNEFKNNGLNDLKFLICTIIRDVEKTLIKVGSELEIKELWFVIKSFIEDIDRVPALIFDEIDAWIIEKSFKAVAKSKISNSIFYSIIKNKNNIL